MSISTKKKVENIHRFVRQNDTKTKLVFNIRNQSNNDTVVMSGWAKSKFQMRLWGTNTLKVDSEMVDEDLSIGQISYTFSGTDLDTPGNYDIILKLTDGSSKVVKTLDRYILTVLEDFSI